MKLIQLKIFCIKTVIRVIWLTNVLKASLDKVLAPQTIVSPVAKKVLVILVHIWVSSLKYTQE